MFTRARGTLPREAAARGSGGEGPFPPVGAFRGSSSGAGAAHRRRAPGIRVRSGRAGAAGGCGGGEGGGRVAASRAGAVRSLR